MNSRTGTVVGASTVAGKKGNALNFNGTTGNYCYDSLITAYQVGHPTVMGWIRRTGTGTILCGSVSGAWNDARGFCFNITSGGNLQFYVGDASGSWKTVTGSTVLQTNTWYHVAGSYDGSALRVYVNGSQDGLVSIGNINIAYTRKSNYGPNPSALYIGIAHNANNTSWTNTPDLAYPFNGTIDDMKLYNRALSQTEIQSDYQPSTLLAYDDYDPFGMVLDGRSYNGGLADTRYKFTSKERDVETGYDYFGARYYDARTGRFGTTDPHKSSYPAITPFGYASNNPMKLIDPNGMDLSDYYDSTGTLLKHVDDDKDDVFLQNNTGDVQTDIDGEMQSFEYLGQSDDFVDLNGALSTPDFKRQLVGFAIFLHCDEGLDNPVVRFDGPRSGLRTLEQNEAVGGSPNSPHLRGTAGDISVAGMSNEALAMAASRSGLWGGVGYYGPRSVHGPHVHVDMEGSERRWLEVGHGYYGWFMPSNSILFHAFPMALRGRY